MSISSRKKRCLQGSLVWNRLRIWVNRHVVWFGLDPLGGGLVWGGLVGYVISVTGWGGFGSVFEPLAALIPNEAVKRQREPEKLN